MNKYSIHKTPWGEEIIQTRTLESLSLFWPLQYGDIVELDGPEGAECWAVNRSSEGWYLHKIDGATVATRHPCIHSLDGMAEFIGAILEWENAYAKDGRPSRY